MQELLLLINMSRVTQLQVNKTLTQHAEKRATYLCDHEFSHKGWNNFVFKFQGENLAKGFSDNLSTFNALMSSLEHKKNILDPNYSYIGLAQKCGITVIEFAGT